MEGFKKVVNRPKKPDYLIAFFYNDISLDVLELSRDHDIPIFMILSDPPKKDRALIGSPREKFANFIGIMRPDESEQGYRLGKTLIRIAKEKDTGGPIRVVGISGHRENYVSIDRVEGLKWAVSEEKNAILEQFFYTDWTADQAGKITSRLFNRYPNLDVIWM